jgi:hypothetical protein
MKRNLIVVGCAALLTLGLSLGSFAGASPDGDVDGVPDAFDNCVNTPNGPLAATVSCTNQEDDNSDGYGNPCDADVNGNGAADLADVNTMLGSLGTAPGASDGDMNCNGAIDLADANAALGALGSAPGPSGLACAGTAPCSAQ